MPIVTPLDGPFFRIYLEIHKTPMFFGKTLNYRFDSASGECGCRAALQTENFGGLFSAIYRLLIPR
jgi:hypothetical protein